MDNCLIMVIGFGIVCAIFAVAGWWNEVLAKRSERNVRNKLRRRYTGRRFK